MKFKLDENLPAELLTDLQAAGHEAESVFDERLVGAPDKEIADVCRSEQRILLTMDKGLADVRAYPPHEYPGIVLFRPGTQGRGETLAFVPRHLSALLAADLAGHLVVVSAAGIRIR